MAFLSGHHVVPTFTAVLMGALWAVRVAGNWRRLAQAALWGAVWLMVEPIPSWPSWFPPQQ